MMSKTVRRTEDLPKGEHWAILSNASEYVPGDERSRTNPGHGYPASTIQYLTYEPFTDEAEFRKELEARLNQSTTNPVRGIHVTETFAGRTIIEPVREV